jgi:hypothetical protein
MNKPKIAVAPVAEYRGVAIVEMSGNKRAVWQGVEYRTDGHSWLILRPGMEAKFHQLFSPDKITSSTPPDNVSMIAPPDERAAKEILDEVARTGESPTSFFLSFREVLMLLGEPARAIPPVKWDEKQGLFVR